MGARWFAGTLRQDRGSAGRPPKSVAGLAADQRTVGVQPPARLRYTATSEVAMPTWACTS